MTDVLQLIREMNPRLNAGSWVFCKLQDGVPMPTKSVAMLRETEGVTVVLSSDDAATLRLKPLYEAAWITLTVDSDLDAVGFLAAITRALATANISCNVFSAVHHDHLFVPRDDGERAMEVLRALQSRP